MSETKEVSELQSIKNHLRVTWNYEDDEIQTSIDDGKAIINGICGESDYTKPGLANKLLKAYCSYDRSGSTSMFEENYKRQLLRLQIQNGFDRFREGGQNG